MLMGVGKGGGGGLVVDIGWGGDANKESPDFRFPEVGISAKNILWSILCPCPNNDILRVSEHFQNFYTFLSLGLFIHQKFSRVLFSREHEYLKLK